MPDCIQEFEKMKLGGGKEDMPRFIIYKISDDKKFIEIDYVAKPGEGFEEMKGKLGAAVLDEKGDPVYCRYIMYDAHITTKSGVEASKLVFIAWSDDDAPVKPKMLYASSKDAIKKSFTGVQEEYQAVDKADLDEAEVNKKAGGTK